MAETFEKPIRVLYFGSYSLEHARNEILIEGLRQNGVEVVEVNDRANFFLKYWRLYRHHRRYRGTYDFMIVGFPGFTAMPLAKMIATAPVVFDVFLSTYDSNVFDRKVCEPKSLRAMYYYFLDWFTCRLADLVLLDTDQHIEYFVSTFHIPRYKFLRIFVGADDRIFFPKDVVTRARSRFLVLFWGYVIPMHGVSIILKAAKDLADEDTIHFRLICGNLTEQIVKMKEDFDLKNVEVLKPVNAEELREHIDEADVCLGIFGSTEKAQRVIPNKVYQALACQKAVLTSSTPAIDELLTDRVNVVLCDTANPKDLARKILWLKNEPNLRDEIAKRGRELYLTKLTPRVLASELSVQLTKLLLPFPWLKRVFDLLISSLALIFFLPFVVLILIIYAFEMSLIPRSRGSLLYSEIRISQGKPFRLYKFRIFKTQNIKQFMNERGYVDTKSLEKNRENLTYFGKLLKQIYMDELPQLVNVFRGEMTLVGPRPTNVANYENGLKKGNIAKRLLKAGITGYFQSHKAILLDRDQEQIDKEYLNLCRRSSGWKIVLYDLKIVLITVKTIFKAKGV